MTRIVSAAAAVLCAAAIVSGCGGASNDGGDTTCKDFLALGDKGKDAVVARMLKERNGSNSSTGDVVVKRLAIVGFCQPADKQGSKIGDLA
jgi:acid stress chaperone HdeA